ncbi:MBL fold metallo-hydrolase [Glycomyces buryatensis]|uniref:MBL fold metallo-hydrolase n=1 Tax=Glycomyces buryatensis TaxID=2570927 RepID=A0A4S8Q9L6_9ACTN|nr:MBL fold metallo-hydrolase [Glycomyces buryatensis]THV37034.1 MBL fold metallo-hydrolase [Glycomyces buryatensis]
MLIETLVADAFGTNCYVLADGPGSECVVVDPGIGIAPRLEELLRDKRLKPVAVMLTHGHLDHTFSVTPVCGANDVPAYIHAADRHLLEDPMQGFGPGMMSLVGTGLDWTEPDDVAVLADGGALDLAGMTFTVDHAPGHTQGSAMFNIGAADPFCLTGDVLFNNGIGRTDLPGGSETQMSASLVNKVLPKDDHTVILPGHGPRSTIGAERAGNAYLHHLVAAHRA